MFIGHKIETPQTITLYIDPGFQEFSSELGTQEQGKKLHFNESIRIYLKEKVPNLNPNIVKVMMGTIVVATVSMVGGNHTSTVEAASNGQVQNHSKHTVANGDTLYGIARQYNLTVSQLKRLNHLTGDMIYPGQTLVISETPPPRTTATYTVNRGDTLYSIANSYNMSVDQLKQLNNLTSNTIQVGQTLQVIGTAPESSQIQAQTYTVQPGDSLYSIAQRANTTVDQIMKNNQLTSSIIYVGQTLQLGNAKSTPPQNVASATYTVKAGDTLYGIARTYNMSVTELKNINNLTSNTLSIGQVINVTGNAKAESNVQNREQVLKDLVSDSYNFIGIPYLWGGRTTAGFDCSGFVSFMHARHGIDIPRNTSAGYYTMGTSVSKANLQPGDLVFFAVNNPGQISHVGFYVGNNEFISATSSKGIAVVSMDNSYWSKYYVGAKRVY
ncbi:LysM peptidoglycan-binding domain-containing protein [Fredinandcohnia sp. QZ13]|uniref:C40 family peptidase n=1 Tax=Fredinandcohnia sp. QZ13 TaxID=3073144 RepID=UPI002852F77F|nr:LysM peptidoglycan-binding domain-containing protein [Fredinandcohnia sp. QZ13]MDR4889383.1 LysM peptidoglycan-binding domain-containing protein [Fredinandcohnia sp. QZ13]